LRVQKIEETLLDHPKSGLRISVIILYTRNLQNQAQVKITYFQEDET